MEDVQNNAIFRLLHNEFLLPKPICTIVNEYKGIFIYENLVCKLDDILALDNNSTHSKPSVITHSNVESKLDEYKQIHFVWPKLATLITLDNKKSVTIQDFNIRPCILPCYFGKPFVTTPNGIVYMLVDYYIMVYSFAGTELERHDESSRFRQRIPPANITISSNYDKLFVSDPNVIFMYDILENGHLGSKVLITKKSVPTIPLPSHPNHSYSGFENDSSETKLSKFRNLSLPMSFYKNMIYALDAANLRVLIFDVLAQTFIASWALITPENNESIVPIYMDITVHNDYVYICTKINYSSFDINNGQYIDRMQSGIIHIFNINGQYAHEWIKPEDIKGYPASIVFNNHEACVSFAHNTSYNECLSSVAIFA